MIELPEAATLARQMNTLLPGKRIAEAVRGNTPHKFAFYNHTPEEYADLLRGRVLGAAQGDGSFLRLAVEPDLMLLFGEGGERLAFHTPGQAPPKKHHFYLRFEDDSALSVTVQGWGFAQLLHASEFPPEFWAGKNRVSPLSPAFDSDFFLGLFSELKAGETRSVKYFLISKPGVWGIGNGCLQDILFRARLHARHPAAALSQAQRCDLFEAIRATLEEMTGLGGRDSELDLFGSPGGYRRQMHNGAVGQPCPVCAAPIQKDQYLGGAIYFCPLCQRQN